MKNTKEVSIAIVRHCLVRYHVNGSLLECDAAFMSIGAHGVHHFTGGGERSDHVTSRENIDFTSAVVNWGRTPYSPRDVNAP